MKTYTLGIDLHKKSSVWVLIDDERTVLWKGDVASHPDDINRTIKKLSIPPATIRAAIEPVTGWRWVVAQLRDAGMDVHIANPQKVRLIAQSDQKHDKGDALMLAELLRSGYFPEAHRASDEMYYLRSILRALIHCWSPHRYKEPTSWTGHHQGHPLDSRRQSAPSAWQRGHHAGRRYLPSRTPSGHRGS